MKNLYILGAGGYGREIASYIKSTKEVLKSYNFKGFLDDNLEALKDIEYPYKVVGAISNFKFTDNDEVILAIGSIEIKKKIVAQLKGKVNFLTFVADESYIGNNVELGVGTLICPGVKLPANIKIGNFVSINIDSRIGHDSIIGDYCSIMPNVDVGGECVIEGGVFLGVKSTIIPRTKVAKGTVVGVASVILKDVKEPNGTYFGCPARRMK